MARRPHPSRTVLDCDSLQADLEEALAALDFVGRALERSVADGLITGPQLSALAVVGRMRRKHQRSPRTRMDAAA